MDFIIFGMPFAASAQFYWSSPVSAQIPVHVENNSTINIIHNIGWAFCYVLKWVLNFNCLTSGFRQCFLFTILSRLSWISALWYSCVYVALNTNQSVDETRKFNTITVLKYCVFSFYLSLSYGTTPVLTITVLAVIA